MNFICDDGFRGSQCTYGETNRIHFSTVVSATVIIYTSTDIPAGRKTTRTCKVYYIYYTEGIYTAAIAVSVLRFFTTSVLFTSRHYCIISSNMTCDDEKVTGRSRIGLTIKSVSMNCRHRRPYTQNPFCRHHPFPADR